MRLVTTNLHLCHRVIVTLMLVMAGLPVIAGQGSAVSVHEKLMQTRAAFSRVDVRRLDDNSIRYTMVYTGPDRHYKSIRFGLYPASGQARAYSVLSGRLYRGRRYPVNFECSKLADTNEKSLRLLLDRVDYQ